MNIPDFDTPFRNQNTADNRNQNIANVPDEAHNRHNDTGNKLRSPAGIIQLAVNIIELFKGLLLPSEYFYNLMTCVHFLDMSV
ncbi:hypothetical protein D3C78_863980 [compost metagenome]